MARRYNQLRSRAKLSNEVEIRIIEQKIKSIEHCEENGEYFLKITTENGNRCKISEQDNDFIFNRWIWELVYDHLEEGDSIELHTARGRILRTKLNIMEGRGYLRNVEVTDDDVVLTIEEDDVPDSIETIKKGSFTIVEDVGFNKNYISWLEIANYIDYKVHFSKICGRIVGILIPA